MDKDRKAEKERRKERRKGGKEKRKERKQQYLILKTKKPSMFVCLEHLSEVGELG